MLQRDNKDKLGVRVTPSTHVMVISSSMLSQPSITAQRLYSGTWGKKQAAKHISSQPICLHIWTTHGRMQHASTIRRHPGHTWPLITSSVRPNEPRPGPSAATCMHSTQSHTARPQHMWAA